MNEVKPGDILVNYGKGFTGANHVSLIVSVFGRPIVYESTMDDRPACVRTGRADPKGCQAHFVDDVVNRGGAYKLSLICPLYNDEEDRLLEVAESCLGRGFEFIGGQTSSAFVARILASVGIIRGKNAQKLSPRRLVKYLVRQGLYNNPVAII